MIAMSVAGMPSSGMGGGGLKPSNGMGGDEGLKPHSTGSTGGDGGLNPHSTGRRFRYY